MCGWCSRERRHGRAALIGSLVIIASSAVASAELPSPVLNTVFPAGGRAGTSVSVTVEGTALDEMAGLRLAAGRITAKKTDGPQWTLTIPADVPPGIYDLRVVGKYGLSGPRAFVIGNRPESVETEANDTLAAPNDVPVDNIVNGRLDKPGDIDSYRFAAEARQRVVLEVWAERLDSKLRAVMEVYDAQGQRLAVNRGRAGTMDPLVDFLAPTDGFYTVKLFDQTFAGSESHFYRLDIDTGPRPAFVFPPVVASGETTRVTLFGRNLSPANHDPNVSTDGARGRVNTPSLDSIEIDVLAPAQPAIAPVPLHPSQIVYDAFPFRYPGGNGPVLVGLTDVAIFRGGTRNQSFDHAQPLTVPSEACGQLTRGDQRDWYVIEAREGEVLWLEAFGARIGAPVDLDIVVLDAAQRELLRLADCQENLGDKRFPTQHSDPSGRFVAPTDGRYFLMVRNLFGGLNDDPSRVYRLRIRREDPDFHVAAIPRHVDQSAGFNVWRGGREMLELVPFRHRGMTGPIRISAANLPPGVTCPDVWIGPGAERVPLVVSAELHTPPFVGGLQLVAHGRIGNKDVARPVRGGTMVWAGVPTGWGRLTDEIPLALAPESPLLVRVAPWEARVFDYGTPRVFQNSTIDLSVDIERRIGDAAPIRLKGVGLPPGMTYQTATIPAGSSKGWISFSVPASLPPGPYTFAVQADTEFPLDKKQVPLTTCSNAITVQVESERIRPEVDALAPRKIARGKAIKIPIRVDRKNGFIGKILGELIAPGGVVGLQARGVAFESQLEAAEIQVVAADNAPLGQHAMLRLELVGMWEDRAVCRGTRFIELEITD